MADLHATASFIKGIDSCFDRQRDVCEEVEDWIVDVLDGLFNAIIAENSVASATLVGKIQVPLLKSIAPLDLAPRQTFPVVPLIDFLHF